MLARMLGCTRMCLLPLTLAWLGTTFPVACQSDPLKSAIEKIKSTNAEERLRGKQEILDIRRKIIDEMISVVKSAPANVLLRNRKSLEHSSKLIAIEILGDLKADEAVDVLLDNIYFAQDAFTSETLFEELSPAAEALVKIGKPAFERIWDKLASVDFSSLPRFTFSKEDEDARKLEHRLRSEQLPGTLYRIFRDIMGHEGLREYLKRRLDEQKSKDNQTLLKNLRFFAKYARLPEEYWREK